MIPLIKIQPLQAGYPAIYLSDRRCTVGRAVVPAAPAGLRWHLAGHGQRGRRRHVHVRQRRPRDARSGERRGPVPRGHRVLAAPCRARGIKLDLWKGEIVNWQFDCGAGVQGHRRRWPVRTEPALPLPEDLPHVLEGRSTSARARIAGRRARSGPLPRRRRLKCDKGYETRERMPGARHEAVLRRR